MAKAKKSGATSTKAQKNVAKATVTSVEVRKNLPKATTKDFKKLWEAEKDKKAKYRSDYDLNLTDEEYKFLQSHETCALEYVYWVEKYKQKTEKTMETKLTINKDTFASVKTVAELQEMMQKLQEDLNKYGEMRYKELAPKAVKEEGKKKAKKTKAETTPAPKTEAKTETKREKKAKVAQVKMSSLSAEDVKKLGLKFVKVEEWKNSVLLQGDSRSIYNEMISLNLRWNPDHKGWKIPAIKNDKYGDTYGSIAKALHLRKIKVG